MIKDSSLYKTQSYYSRYLFVNSETKYAEIDSPAENAVASLKIALAPLTKKRENQRRCAPWYNW